MTHNKIMFIADTTAIVNGTIAGFSFNEVTGLVIALANLIYIVARLIDRFKNKEP